PVASSRRRTASPDAHRSRGRGRRRSVYGPGRCQVLPADARLPRAVAAGLADTQAKGDTPGPRGAPAGGSGGGGERPPGGSAPAVAGPVVANPLADSREELDLATAKDDAPGTPASCRAQVSSR